MSLRIHLLQHVPYEGLGCIAAWCEKKGHSVNFTRFYENQVLPDLKERDWIIIMGGPMGVYETDKYPWLDQEITFISKAIRSGKTVLGICLGSQLIASALGARVYKNPEKEIGWFDVMLTEQGKSSFLLKGLKHKTTVFHWHGDTFNLPDKSDLLAFSNACSNQIFLAEERVMGIQFHFEITASGVSKMIENGRNEMVQGTYIQSEKEILTSINLVEQNNQIMFSILDGLEAKTIEK